MLSSREAIGGRNAGIPRPYRVSSVIYEEHGQEVGSKIIAIVAVKPEKPSNNRSKP